MGVFGHNREEDYASELEDAAHKLSNLADEARNKQSFGGSFGDFFKRTKFARITPAPPAPSQAAAEQASQADAEQGAVEESTAINLPDQSPSEHPPEQENHSESFRSKRKRLESEEGNTKQPP